MIAPAVAVTPIMNALVAAAARSGMPHHAFSTGTLMMPPPMPSSDDTLPAMNDATIASGSRLMRYVTMPPLSSSWNRPAEHAGIGRRIEDHVPAVQTRQHDQRDDDRDDAEQPLQRGLREKLRGDAAEQAAGGGRHLEQHAEPHVDQLLAGAAGRHGARRRDHGGQADRGGRGDRKIEAEVEERHEEDAAAEAEQRAERAGDACRRRR